MDNTQAIAQVDRYRVSELTKYFRLSSPSTLYNRIAQLGIPLTKDGRTSYISADDMRLLEKLDIHLKDGGTFESFQGSPATGSAIAKRDERTEGTMALALSMMELIKETQEYRVEADLLAPQRILAEAADLQVLLSSQQLRSVLGKRSLVRPEYRDFGFLIKRIIIGKKPQWQVIRLLLD